MFYWVVKVFLTPFLRLFWRPWVEGVENIPSEGAALLASNHLSFLDHFFLPLVIPRRVTFLAKSDYFTEAGIKGWFKRVFFSGVGQIPIDRSGGKASEGALRSGVRVLSQGRLLGIYPEGTRSPDGRLYRGKIGVARMALEAGVPVIPVAMIGTFEVQPPGQVVPKIRRVGMRIGRPLDFSRYTAMADDRFVLRSVTDEIMYEMMALSGQEYVDMYAARAKEELALARAAQARTAGGTGGPPGTVAADAASAATGLAGSAGSGGSADAAGSGGAGDEEVGDDEVGDDEELADEASAAAAEDPARGPDAAPVAPAASPLAQPATPPVTPPVGPPGTKKRYDRAV